MPPTDQDARPFAELCSSGLLWLINRVALHPRGLALALHADEAGDMYGWSLLPSPDGGPWTYPEDTEPGHHRRAEATLAAAHGRPVRPDEDARPPGRPRVDEEPGRSVRTPDAETRPPHPTSTDADRPGTDEGRTGDRRTEVRQAIDAAFLAPDEDGRPIRIIPAGDLTLGPDALTDVERQRKTIRDTLNAELSHDDEGAVWNLTCAISRALDAMPRYATPAAPSGIRGLLEHVGLDTSGRCIFVAGECVDHGSAGLLCGPARCSCGSTGELLRMNEDGSCWHAVRPAGEVKR